MVSSRYSWLITFILQPLWSNQMTFDGSVKIYHHPNPEIKSFLTMESIFPASVGVYKNPFNKIEKENLQRLDAITSQIVMGVMGLPGVKEIRIKPKEIRMKKEEEASWDDIEDKVCQILNRALIKKQIKRVK